MVLVALIFTEEKITFTIENLFNFRIVWKRPVVPIMLNRRLLRIRAMQHLYAYQRCRRANYELAFESIKEAFLPDLNSMEVQDTVALAEQAAQAAQLLEARLHGKLSTGAANPRIEQAVDEALRTYEQRCRKDQQFLRGQMVSRTEKIKDYYLRLLQLPEAILQEAGRDSKKKSASGSLDTRSVANLISNRLLMAIRTHDEWPSIAPGQPWESHRPEVRQLFKTLKVDPEYLSYQAMDRPSLEQDVAIVRYIINTVALNHEAIVNVFEEDGVNWDEDKKIIKSLANRTFKSLEKSQDGTIEIASLTPNWADDRAFFEELYDHTLRNDEEYEALISEKSKNWAADRIASLDNVIMKMAIAEMIHFGSIPVKVTINEYVDISKLYSTQKSRQFINGMLDVIAQELQQRKLIRKSGRGLMDNQ